MIELHNVTKYYHYGKSGEVAALRGIDLSVNRGEMTAIVGPSGAGKSTLLHVLGGMCRIDGGSYLFEGTCVSSLGDRALSKLRNERIGIVMQEFALVEEYSVLENTLLPLYFRRRAQNKRNAALDALEQTGVAHLQKKNVSELSGGERQRVAIARCLCQHPDVILADEPTGQLDSENSKKIMDIFSQLNRSGMTIVIVTHDKTVADACSHTISMRDGRTEHDERYPASC